MEEIYFNAKLAYKYFHEALDTIGNVCIAQSLLICRHEYSQESIEVINKYINHPYVSGFIEDYYFDSLKKNNHFLKYIDDLQYGKNYSIAEALLSDKRFVAIYLSLSHGYMENMKINLEKEDPIEIFPVYVDHGNIIIIDKLKKEIERYDPNGGTYKMRFGRGNKIMFEEIDDEIKCILYKIESTLLDYKYFSPQEYCGFTGPQIFARYVEEVVIEGINGGFCGWWSFYYLYIRLQYPNASRENIALSLVSFQPLQLFETIYNFRKNVMQYSYNKDNCISYVKSKNF